MSAISPHSSYSISSLPESSIATPRFSVNSNLMNYSIPKNNNVAKAADTTPFLMLNNHTNHRRDIQQGSTDTRTRQLEAQIEALTLSNVKLQRANRLLKVDTDNLLEQKTQPLHSTIRQLTLNNVRLQRSTRLLQQDLEEKTLRLNQYQTDQVASMKTVGPEYEYLVQMINVLHRQISGDVNCDDTCCYTMAPVEPPTTDTHHSCRPMIHSTVSQGSYAAELEHKISHLENIINELTAEKEALQHQQAYKDTDFQTLKNELEMKDAIVSQLEQDFMDLEKQLTIIQKNLEHSDYNHSSPSTPPDDDPERQSHILMESKRRSLAIKDTDVLEKMLRNSPSHQRFGITPPSPTSSLDQDEEPHGDYNDENDDDAERSDTDASSPASPIATTQQQPWTPFLSTTSLPCKYNTPSNSSNTIPPDSTLSPAAFIMMAVLLGSASQMGITDDWTLPLTLTLMVSGFLWTGGAKGVQLKVKI